MSTFVDKMQSPAGVIIISIIIGLGIASFFRATCSGGNCIVITGPNPEVIAANTYKIDDKCYQYVPYATKCDALIT